MMRYPIAAKINYAKTLYIVGTPLLFCNKLTPGSKLTSGFLSKAVPGFGTLS